MDVIMIDVFIPLYPLKLSFVLFEDAFYNLVYIYFVFASLATNAGSKSP